MRWYIRKGNPWLLNFRLLEQGYSLKKLQLMPELAELDHGDPYLHVSKEILRRTFVDVL